MSSLDSKQGWCSGLARGEKGGEGKRGGGGGGGVTGALLLVQHRLELP